MHIIHFCCCTLSCLIWHLLVSFPFFQAFNMFGSGQWVGYCEHFLGLFTQTSSSISYVGSIFIVAHCPQ
jgi:hypothetical protein